MCPRTSVVLYENNMICTTKKSMIIFDLDLDEFKIYFVCASVQFRQVSKTELELALSK